jgi:hypothetical protein
MISAAFLRPNGLEEITSGPWAAPYPRNPPRHELRSTRRRGGFHLWLLF